MAKKKYTIEIEEDDYKRFKVIAKHLDSTAVQELRKFVKKFNSENQNLVLFTWK